MSYQIPLKYILPAFVALLVLLIAAWAFGLSPVAALTGSNPQVSESNRQEQVTGYPYDTIVVSGSGTATGVPDLANLSLGVSVTAETVAAARDQAAASMEKVMQALATTMSSRRTSRPVTSASTHSTTGTLALESRSSKDTTLVTG